MYYAHFGLNEAPFRITPNTEVFFAGGNRGAILDALIYAIAQGEGIVKVTGEVGTGKTMLCNMLQSRLPAQIETVYLAHPSVSPEEILHAIAFELQLKVARDANRMEVMQALYSYLLERHAQNKQVVIFVEESQNMPIATLEEVRLLSNLETGKHKLLQIVLFGQPELDENLRQPHIRQLRERITHSFALPPLAAQEIGEYLMFRMRAVGYRGPDLFSAPVVKRIAHASAGLTRRVNLIADKALLAAFAENTHTVQPKHIAAAIRDSEFARDAATATDSRKRWLIAAATVLVAAGAALYWAMRQTQALSPVSQSRPVAPAGEAQPQVPASPAAMPSSGDNSAATSSPGDASAATLGAAYASPLPARDGQE
ncbi:MAG: ExeA family protein, partial [Burkholderiales bacterium]